MFYANDFEYGKNWRGVLVIPLIARWLDLITLARHSAEVAWAFCCCQDEQFCWRSK